MTRIAFRIGLALAAGFSATSAFAHDFFLLPERFAVPTGEIAIQATVSAGFPRLENMVPADRVGRLLANGPGDPGLRVVGPDAHALGLSLSAPRPGLVVAAVAALPRDVEYGEDRIGIILEEYRIPASAVAGLEQMPRPRTLRVSSRRFAKTIICADACTDRSAMSRPLGADLEFVGGGNDPDHFLLLSHGRPLPDHPVDLVMSDGNRRHLRSDARGAVHLPADARGPLMLFAARMEPPAQGDRFILNLSSLTLSR